MDEEKRRKLKNIGLAMLIIGFIIKNGLIIIAGITLLIFSRKKENKKENKETRKKIPLDVEEDYEKLQAVFEMYKEKADEDKKYRSNVDVRQFKGRKDVTKEEVAEYLWIHKLWEGWHEKDIILDEIIKVCNLNEEDKEWIMNEHYNHKGNDGTIGSGCWERNEEIKAILDYERKKIVKKDKELDRNEKENDNLMKKLGLDEILEEIENKEEYKKTKENHKYIYYYEEWLKEKGYV